MRYLALLFGSVCLCLASSHPTDAAQGEAIPSQRATFIARLKELSAVHEVLLIGDSITAGRVSGAPGPSFVSILRQQLPSVDFEQAACAGSSSADWVRPFAELFPSCAMGGAYEKRVEPNLPAQVAVVMLGTNDAIPHLEPAPSTAAAYRTAISELVESLGRDGVEVVLLVPPPPLGEAMKRGRAALAQYRDALREIAAEEEIAFLGPDLSRILRPELMEDEVHPNAEGHRLIAMSLVDYLRALAPPP